MPLGRIQQDTIASQKSNYVNGLSYVEANSRRRNNKNANGGDVLNVVKPPVNCPSWVCCLLPCILKVESMKKFKQIIPQDAETLRDGTWTLYDAPSVVIGDIIRLNEGDIVPADCLVLSLGMDHIKTDGPASTSDDSLTELSVDISAVTGSMEARTASVLLDGTVSTTELYYGSTVKRGSCIAIVTAIGDETLLARLIRSKKWPPSSSNGLHEYDEEIGMSLVPKSNSSTV